MKRFLILLLMIFSTNSFASGIASNSASAPCTNNTLETYSGNSNLAADWQPNVIKIDWYNDDDVLSVQSTAQTCTYDGSLTIPSTAPTKTGYTFAGWTVKTKFVPDGYTQLEYLESSGTQWIDTGIVPAMTYSIEVKALKQANRSLFGSVSYNLTGSGELSYFYLGSDTFVDRVVFPENINNSISHLWGFDAQRSKIYCDDIVVDVVVGGSAPVGNLRLFARNNTYIDAGSHQIYYVKLWNGSNQLIFHGIPAKRNSDNVLGMWDTVSKTFFTNQGTGSFVAGPVVQ